MVGELDAEKRGNEVGVKTELRETGWDYLQESSVMSQIFLADGGLRLDG